MEKTLIVGDVHGCSDELDRLLEAAEWRRGERRLIFVGDLINKGPDSFGALELARESGALTMLGNHEAAFLRYVRHGRFGHAQFDELQERMGSDLIDWISYIQSFPLYHEEEEMIVVHAGLHPTLPLSETPGKILTRIRTWDGEGRNLDDESQPPWFDLYRGNKLVVYGHWARRGLTLRERTIGLDSGCVYGNQLSGLLLPERRLIQVQAAEMYVIPTTLPEEMDRS